MQRLPIEMEHQAQGNYMYRVPCVAVCLAFAKTILERNSNAIKSAGTAFLVLNEHQSTHLWRIIQKVYNYLSSSQLPHNERHKYCPKIFEEFAILVTRAYAQLISEYNGLEAAILHGNHTQVYKELSLDLQACVELFRKSTGHPISVEDDAIIKEAGSLQFWCTIAQRDEAELRNRLDALVAQPGLDEEKKHLARCLRARETRNDVIRQDDHLPRSYSVPPECTKYPCSLQHIGHGSFGTVYKVKWLGMTCAKKHFHGPFDENFIQEFMQEVNILAQLDHPHIVKLLCVKLLYPSEKPEISFLMEFMPMSLSEFIVKRRQGKKFIVLSAAIDMMLQIARGMEYLHEQGIVHRDLKSSNILVAPLKISKLCDEGYADVKLTDFGLAKMKVFEPMKPTRKNMGTTQWMAPEVFSADEEIDWTKADVYSFAMTCSEILMGDTPFRTCPLSKLCARIKGGERPRLPKSCPKDLASLLRACWHARPSSRPSFTEIIHRLTVIKSNLLRFRWDGSECVGICPSSWPSFPEIIQRLTMVKGNLLRLRWDGSGFVELFHSGYPSHLRGLRFLAYVGPTLGSLKFNYSDEQKERLGLEFWSPSPPDSVEDGD